MSDNEELNKSVAEPTTTTSKSTIRRPARRRDFRRRASRRTVLTQIYKLLRRKDRITRRSRQQSTGASRKMTHTATQTNSNNEQINQSDEGGVQTVERRTESIEPTSAQDLGPAHIAPVAEITSSTGGQLVMLSATNGPVSTNTDSASSSTSQPQFTFVTKSPMKVAISYAGKTGDRVKMISQLVHDKLKSPNSPSPVFYYPKFQDEVTGLNGMDKLLHIYRQASLVVVFLSTAYHTSPFCMEEWRTIKNRFMYDQRDQSDRLLFVKVSDYKREELGLVSGDLYIDGLKFDDQEVANMITSRFLKVGKISDQGKA